ncbi:hypothetical protein CCP3SC15_1430007 [Gammaproteobacteria bacterium]
MLRGKAQQDGRGEHTPVVVEHETVLMWGNRRDNSAVAHIRETGEATAVGCSLARDGSSMMSLHTVGFLSLPLEGEIRTQANNRETRLEDCILEEGLVCRYGGQPIGYRYRQFRPAARFGT